MSALTILTWHSIDPGGSVISIAPQLFSKQMDAIAAAGFRGVSLREAVRHREMNGRWPGKTVVLTFDDGYENFSSFALPAILRHGFSATVFLISRHMGGINDWGPAPEGLGRQKMMSWNQVREMSSAGIEAGAHTRTHPDLRMLGNDALNEEISGSRREIEDEIGSPVETFAYPFGYLNEAACRIVGAEFRAACTTSLSRVTGEDPHLLPRLDIYYLRDLSRFSRAIEGRLDGYLRVRRWGRSVRSLIAG